MIMVLSKTAEEIEFILSLTSYICGSVVLLAVAGIAAYLVERRVSEWELRQKIKEEIRLTRARNEVERERENFRQIDISNKNLVEKQRLELKEKDALIAKYREQLDAVEVGDFSKLGRLKNAQV